MMNLWTVGKILSGLVSTTAGLFALLLWSKQEQLIYLPDVATAPRLPVPTPKDADVTQTVTITITTSDGEKLHAYKSELRASWPWVLMLHGNAGNIGHRLPFLKVLQDMRVNVLMVEYRGFGRSTGRPNEKGMKLDGKAALDEISKIPQHGPIIVFGQSVGGALAIFLAATYPSQVQGMIIENTFLSIPRLIPSVVPQLKYFTWLCHQRWDSASLIGLVPTDVPVLFMTGKKDQLIPLAHMTELFVLAKKGKREWWESEEGDHNDTCARQEYWVKVKQWMTEHFM